MANFPIGAIVELKSGGPKMTVIYVGPDSMTKAPIVECTWFDGANQMNGSFPPDALQIARPGQLGSAV
jgi:uncharacterized protein YodC (DUF2158 family)